MKGTRLIAYLKNFSKPELNRLQLFISSPYHKVFPHTRQLFSILCRHYPFTNDTCITKEQAFKQLFPGQVFRLQLLSNQMKYLCEAIEEFIACEQLTYKPEQGQLLLLNYLRYKDVKLYKDSIDKLELAIRKPGSGDTGEQLMLQVNYLQERDTFFSLSEQRTGNDAIQLKSDAIDHWYIFQKLKTWCEMQNRGNIVAAEYSYPLREELLTYVEKHSEKLFAVPGIKLYYEIYYSLMQPENEQWFSALLQTLEKSEQHLTLRELRTYYDFAQNYCIKKLNSGNLEYAGKLFQLYEKLLNKKILFNDKGQLSAWDYKNIVTLSLRLKKNKWCLGFIEHYKLLLEKGERENAYIYNLAYYHAQTRNYGEAKRLLQQVEFSDQFYQLGSKAILLRCYYELEDVEAFLAHCQSFFMLLKRSKTISDYQKKVHFNLILYTKKVFRLRLRKSNVSGKEITALKEKINTIKTINNLQWLLEKIEEL